MSRDITSAAETAAGADHVRMIGLALFDFAGGAWRVASTPYNVPWSGDTYSGLGVFGKVSPVEEAAEQRKYALDFSLSGVDPALISVALQEFYQGRDVKFWLALLDSNYEIIADPVLAFWGLMDTMDVVAGTEAEITVTAVDRRSRWEKGAGLRFNHATQQSLYPGDLGFEFVEQMVEKELVWG